MEGCVKVATSSLIAFEIGPWGAFDASGVILIVSMVAPPFFSEEMIPVAPLA
jgi:hypothetical protein